jgi:hypothetical protein
MAAWIILYGSHYANLVDKIHFDKILSSVNFFHFFYNNVYYNMNHVVVRQHA